MNKIHKLNSRKMVLLLLLPLFLLLNWGCYESGYILEPSTKTVVWKTYRIGEEKVFPMPYVDYETFVILDYIYNGNRKLLAKDKQHVYFRGEILQDAMPDTFQKLSPEFYSDTRHVYRYVPHKLIKIKDADPTSIKTIGHGIWAKDENKVYCGDQVFFPDDIDSFEVLGVGYWARDKLAYYYGGRKVSIFDYNSFRILNDQNHLFAKDIYSVYWLGCPVKVKDPSSFQFSDSSSGSDEYCFYRFFLKDKLQNENDFCTRIIITTELINKHQKD